MTMRVCGVEMATRLQRYQHLGKLRDGQELLVGRQLRHRTDVLPGPRREGQHDFPSLTSDTGTQGPMSASGLQSVILIPTPDLVA